MPAPGPGGTQSSLASMVSWIASRFRAPAREQKKGAPIYTYSVGNDPAVGAAMRAAGHHTVCACSSRRRQVMRAEPVAALYEQHRVHHVGAFPTLEDQQCGFASDFDRASAGFSPDRVDALVWALTDLLVQPMAQFRDLRAVPRAGAAAGGSQRQARTEAAVCAGSVEYEKQQQEEGST